MQNFHKIFLSENYICGLIKKKVCLQNHIPPLNLHPRACNLLQGCPLFGINRVGWAKIHCEHILLDWLRQCRWIYRHWHDFEVKGLFYRAGTFPSRVLLFSNRKTHNDRVWPKAIFSNLFSDHLGEDVIETAKTRRRINQGFRRVWEGGSFLFCELMLPLIFNSFPSLRVCIFYDCSPEVCNLNHELLH